MPCWRSRRLWQSTDAHVPASAADIDATPVARRAVRNRLRGAGVGANEVALDDDRTGCVVRCSEYAGKGIAGEQIALPRLIAADLRIVVADANRRSAVS